MILSGLEFALPLYYGNLVFFPIVRQIRVRTQDWFTWYTNTVALVILEDETVHITILDDRISHQEVMNWLKGNAFLT